ncbi:hypothetical protein OIU78_007774 [Salix suchowensis]|nr:hypothetical protein OIU78_007774 [Salix suchowensis]
MTKTRSRQTAITTTSSKNEIPKTRTHIDNSADPIQTLERIFLMGDEKLEIVMASRDRERDRELLIPVVDSPDLDIASKPSSSSSSASSSHHSGREV